MAQASTEKLEHFGPVEWKKRAAAPQLSRRLEPPLSKGKETITVSPNHGIVK